MTVQQLTDLLQGNGWRLAREEGELRQYKHDTMRQTVTLSGRLDLTVPPGVLRTMLRGAAIEEGENALRSNL